ncbi:unnamed protein product, partial [Prorocentrum cordatum]
EVRIAAGLMHEDFQAQRLNAALGIQILDDLLEQVGKVINSELAAEHSKDGQEWRDWVQSSMRGGVGWAH